MADKRRAIVAALAVVLMIFAEHTYAEHQAYKTGIYIGKAAFNTEDYKNRECLRVRGNFFRSLSDSTALRTGFRDGWREARTLGR